MLVDCVRELVETELNYVNALEMIIRCFAQPLEILLKREDSQLLFGHIRSFHHIHSVFQADLVKAATFNNSRAPKISTCFLNAREKFLKYGEYCASLSRAQALLDELTSKNEAIAAQLDLCQQEANEGKFKLRDLLSLPMQRILKYHLLLAQLIKSTSSSNDDYLGLKRAHDAMVDLGQYINEVKRDTEATHIMNEIEQSIVGLNLPPNTRLIDYGRLITDGKIRIKAPFDMKVKLAAQDTKIPKRYVFVFDKVMLICKLSGLINYQFKEALVLNEFELDPNPATLNETLSKHKDKWRQMETNAKDKWSFMFNLVNNSDGSKYTFYAKSLEMKQKWISAIQRAMDNTRPAVCRSNSNAGSHKFLMHTFDKASSCDICGKLLLGLYYQGYRCRVCFTSVHKKCLASVRSCGPSLPPRTKLTSTRENINFLLTNQPWFNDRMDRDEAQALLEEQPHGTFLVRVSPKHHNSYVISLKYNNKVMHMRVYVAKDNQLYLSQNRYFNSLVELISWYEKNSLIESFNMLDACLQYPYKYRTSC
jgi:guanine nucleotide exchange factor VAV